MHCPRCAHDNPATGKFCSECGERLQAICPACKSPIAPTAKFCSECGQALAAAAPASAPAAVTPPTAEAAAPRFASPDAYTPKHLVEKILTSRSVIEGERKQVTVLFADVSGFTAMSERLDPEDVHAIMDRAFEVILEGVHQHEGTINQFLGDGVMALFGAPLAHEDHAHRALRAALAVQEKLEPLRQDVRQVHGVEFRVRMGINTGLVVVGAIGRDLRMDYTAVGDTVNLAARLLSIAQPGQVVVSRQSHRLTDGFFSFEDLGEFTLKGKSQPVRAWAVTGEMRGRTRLEVSRERGLTPLAGRGEELTRLQHAYGMAAAGVGAVVLIVGEPGVGKSRLLYEFVSGLDTFELEASCVSYGASTPYAPILELLRRHLGAREGMPADEIRTRIVEELRAVGIVSDEPPALLGHLLGLEVAPEFLARLQGAQLKERTFAALRELFTKASEEQPLVLIVENLHWIDATSQEFLAHLAQHVRGSHLLLVVTSRPGTPVGWLPAGAESIVMEGLSAPALLEMTRALVGCAEVSEPLLEILKAKSEGNPLYVEEIVHQLQDTGAIGVEAGEGRLVSATVTIPETVHDIIAARIDRLADTLKRTIQGAAVIGRNFGAGLLGRVLETNGELATKLTELEHLVLIFLTAPEPDRTYSFKHALTQEVAYGSLLERRRRVYHAAVGAGLEELYRGRTEEVAELLAYHFARSAEAEKAVDYAIEAGEKAHRRWANTEALAHFGSALKRLETMPDSAENRLRRIDAVVKQGEIIFALGRHAEHIAALDAIRTIVQESADSRRRAAWSYWAGFLHSIAGSRPEVSIAYCREASTIAEAEGLNDIKAFAECCLTHVYAMAGSLREAVEAGERALPVFEARGNVWWACRTLWGLSIATIYLGQWQRSLECCQRALEHGQALNDRRIQVVSWWRLGWTHIQRGDWETGVRCCQEALALSPSPLDTAMAKAAQGYGMVRLGQVRAGTAQLAEAVAWFDQSHLHLTRSSFGVWLGESYIFQGELGQAREVLDKVLATSRELGYQHLEGIAERLLGQSLVDKDVDTADRHLETAAEILGSVGARNEYAKALVTRAELRRAANDPAEARRLLEQALAVFEALGTLDESRRVQDLLRSTPLG
jgi:class 3 adenylate cyclase/tetratricopeptide (TPR) repeat protein